MPITMYDSVTVGTVPADPPAVAGYVDGLWPTYEPLVWKFPHARHLSIAVNAGVNAECLDVEQGDASPAQAPEWVRRQLGRGVTRPVLYASLSNAQAVLAALEAQGLGRQVVRLWTAHYTDEPHLCSVACGLGFTGTADATQFTSHALARNLDASLCADSFFPAIGTPNHYERYPAEPFAFGKVQLSERATVMEYDRLLQRRRPDRVRLNVLRSHIKLLRDRIWTVAHWEEPANWMYYRGWRWQKLNERLSGRVSP